ncbi:SOS response-associated peptidase family protein [Dyella mobilis]|uniref:Abasic site processing protein n=1 Tax=Dyella mobilis TaxID=1849582 RepID=A0ABS2KA96_9GAMM|nr:SOS response-associated peptidase family protein [Dyella mobilis]MBM7127985.1 SOS response-associated peptidase family protein [Dyella mobilis]GLR00123.1 hypothetical protein GCM10007863_45430 [Dyella mobilis]
MCYSAEVWADYRRFEREFGSVLSIRDFVHLFGRKDKEGKWYIPKALEAAFAHPRSPEEQRIKELIDAHNVEEARRFEQELFSQKTRLNEAERKLQVKETKAAQESVRIATNKIEKAKLNLDDLRRTELKPRDSRIFPGWYAPVMVSEQGQRILLPMRYGCRPAGKPAWYDTKFPGTYNARRDNLEGFWKGQFGHTHGLMVCTTFYENVEGPGGKNQVVQFKPRTGEPMFIACLWSNWTDPKGEEPDLLSFAAITDEPEPEVAETGHDRTIINIKPEHIDAWLNPDPKNIAALHAIFDDKRHPYYEHRLAA